ncbi:hypothetical protein ABK040_011894 [Willaertia magna]
MILLWIFLLTAIIYLIVRYACVVGVYTDGTKENLTNKVIIITGANTGIGKYTAGILYRQGATVILGCRNEERTKEAMKEIIEENKESKNVGKLIYLKLDLCQLQSVKDFVNEFLKLNLKLNILICNAGCSTLAYRFTKDGFEEMFQSNVLGHHLLIKLLLPKLEERDNNQIEKNRIVIVASSAHMFVNDNDFKDHSVKEFITEPITHFNKNNFISTNKQYGFTKCCNIYQTKYFGKQLNNSNVTINCLHPGAIRTSLTRTMPWYLNIGFFFLQYLFFKNVEQGSQNTLHLACSKSVEGMNGNYFDRCKVGNVYPIANNEKVANDVMKICEETIKPYL